MIFRGKDARRRGEFRPGDLATNGAWRKRDPRIIPHSLTLAHVAARHNVKFAVLLSEPDWSGDADARFAERSERYVLLTSNSRWNLTWHNWYRSVQVSQMNRSLSSVVRSQRRRLLPSCHLCYKPEHA